MLFWINIFDENGEIRFCRIDRLVNESGVWHGSNVLEGGYELIPVGTASSFRLRQGLRNCSLECERGRVKAEIFIG